MRNELRDPEARAGNLRRPFSHDRFLSPEGDVRSAVDVPFADERAQSSFLGALREGAGGEAD